MNISPNIAELGGKIATVANQTSNVINNMGQQISLGPGGLPNNFNGINPTSLDFQTGKVLADDFLSPDINNIQTPKPENNVAPGGNYLPSDITNCCLSSLEERLAQTPTEGLNGQWIGDRGESTYVPNDPELKKLLAQYGKTGVEYINGMPDFSPFAKSEVKIENMTSERYNNFSQADKLCADKWNEIAMNNKTDWCARDIADFRHENGFTWHECNDRETCQMIPSEINGKFNHLGGVSECKEFEHNTLGYDNPFDEIDLLESS